MLNYFAQFLKRLRNVVLYVEIKHDFAWRKKASSFNGSGILNKSTRQTCNHTNVAPNRDDRTTEIQASSITVWKRWKKLKLMFVFLFCTIETDNKYERCMQRFLKRKQCKILEVGHGMTCKKGWRTIYEGSGFPFWRWLLTQGMMRYPWTHYATGP